MCDLIFMDMNTRADTTIRWEAGDDTMKGHFTAVY